MESETWRPVVGFERFYQVSDLGRVRNIFYQGYPRKEPKILKPGKNNFNALMVVLMRGDGVRYPKYVHHLVLEAFVGPRPINMECCHFNDDRTDNRLINLRWDTHKANSQDAIRNGKRPTGTKHWKAKLDNKDVLKIRELRKNGLLLRELSDMFDVLMSNISSIVLGKTWKNV